MLALVTTTTAQNSPGTGYTGTSVSQGRALKAKTPQSLDPLRRFWTANGRTAGKATLESYLDFSEPRHSLHNALHVNHAGTSSRLPLPA